MSHSANNSSSISADISDSLSNSRRVLLGFQHVFAMFGATVLVPTLTGMDINVALISAGLGTLIFHFVTGGSVPVFLGSSFAYIGMIQALGGNMVDGQYVADPAKMPYALGALFCGGVLYVTFSFIVRLIGVSRIKRYFPPIVTGPVIMVIGLKLSPVAVNMASANWTLAAIALALVVIISIYTKGFIRLLPISIALLGGYLVAMALGYVDLKAISAGMTGQVFLDTQVFMQPKFSWEGFWMVLPLALVTSMEHVGDITTNGAVVGKNFLEKPGLHKTLLGDGLATILASFLGGPANTTYGENTGVLAVTKVYSPKIIRIAAVIAICMGVIAPIGVILRSIPVAVMGGICIVLFGMIASIGFRMLADAKVDFSESRNMIIIALILVSGLGNASFTLGIFQISGIGLAAIVGLLANAILPPLKEVEEEKEEQLAS